MEGSSLTISELRREYELQGITMKLKDGQIWFPSKPSSFIASKIKANRDSFTRLLSLEQQALELGRYLDDETVPMTKRQPRLPEFERLLLEIIQLEHSEQTLCNPESSESQRQEPLSSGRRTA